MPDFGALRHGSQGDVLTAMNDRDSTCPCGCLALFVLFPSTFFMAHFGAGWPTIIAVHLEHTSTPVIAAASVVSIGLAVTLIRMSASFLPQGAADDAEGVPRVSATKHTKPISGKSGLAEQR